MSRRILLSILLIAACSPTPIDPFHATPDGGAGSGDRPCDAELEAFRSTVEEPILRVRCAGCHNEQGPARQTRLVLSNAETDEATLANYRAARSVAIDSVDDESVLLLRPTGRFPDGHTGGTLIEARSREAEALRAFVASVRTEACDPATVTSCVAPTPGPRRLRRLTHVEYANTIRDLVGVSIDTSGFVVDPRSNGFDDDADTLTVSNALAAQTFDAAERAASLGIAALRSRYGCLAVSSPTSTCVTAFVRDFGARAFRRPLGDAEIARWTSLRTELAGIDAASATERLVATMLASPGFLYRSEIGVGAGDLATLDGYEVAAELSYLLTSSMPDDALRARAADGTILDPTVLESEARRLLGTEAARPAIIRFFVQWLDLDRLTTVPKDASTYPSIDPALRASMQRETEAFLEHVLFEGDGRLETILASTESFVDARLADHYGLDVDPPAGTMSRVSFPGGTRLGLLSHASVLTVHARANDSSPVHRGKLVRERLFCQPLAPPPPGVNATTPPLDPSLSTRERYLAHSTVEPCASCHRLMDPIGFGFERFDGIGRLRGATETHGEIVASRSIDGTFGDFEALTSRVAASDEVADCFARQWLRYAYGLVEDASLECLLDGVQRRFEESGGEIDELLVALIVAPHFRSRVTAETDATP